MKSITANWFIAKIRCDQTQETGILKKNNRAVCH